MWGRIWVVFHFSWKLTNNYPENSLVGWKMKLHLIIPQIALYIGFLLQGGGWGFADFVDSLRGVHPRPGCRHTGCHLKLSSDACTGGSLQYVYINFYFCLVICCICIVACFLPRNISMEEDASCESAWNKVQKIADTFPCYLGSMLVYIMLTSRRSMTKSFHFPVFLCFFSIQKFQFH